MPPRGGYARNPPDGKFQQTGVDCGPGSEGPRLNERLDRSTQEDLKRVALRRIAQSGVGVDGFMSMDRRNLRDNLL
jgi:hypothetical protein